MTFNQIEKSKNYVSKWLYNCFLNLFIYPSIWVAGGIASLGFFSQKVLELENNWQPIALIFVTALIPYNLDRIFDSYVQKIPEAKAQLFFRKPYIFVLLLSAIIATALLLYDAPVRVRYVSCAGIVPLIYGTPLFPWKSKSGLQWYPLKDIPGSKAWIVGSILTPPIKPTPLIIPEITRPKISKFCCAAPISIGMSTSKAEAKHTNILVLSPAGFLFISRSKPKIVPIIRAIPKRKVSPCQPMGANVDICANVNSLLY